MTNSITPRHLFAAIAFNNLLPYVLEQEDSPTTKEAMELAATSAWAAADYLIACDPQKDASND